MVDLPELTEKQNEFVKEYFINGLNATEAYRTVYGNEHSKIATCSVEGSRLLKNPKVALWIEHYKQNMREHIENEIKYSADDAFKECEELKMIALQSVDQYGRPNVSAANKAVEMKIKLKGLMKDDAPLTNSIVFEMGKVEIDGETLELNIGDGLDDSEENKAAENS